MLYYALVFAVLALVFGLLGFGRAASGFATIARFLLVLFLILFVLSLLFGNRLIHSTRLGRQECPQFHHFDASTNA